MAKSPRLALHWQILIAIAVAVIAGLLAGEHGGVFGVTFYSVFDFLGRMFLNALKMLIVPLIASSMIVGVAGIGSSESLGRLGGRTLFFYAATSLVAIVLGLSVINIVKPGSPATLSPAQRAQAMRTARERASFQDASVYVTALRSKAEVKVNPQLFE